MKKIEFVTRVRINGVYYTDKDIPEEEIRKLVQKKIEDVLIGMNYERKSAG